MRRPLLSFDSFELRPPGAAPPSSEFGEPRRRTWIHSLPLAGTVLLLLAPHPSLLIVLVDFHLHTLHSRTQFFLHLAVIYTLTGLIFSSLIVCVTRNPGPVPSLAKDDLTTEQDDEQVGLAEALEDDFTIPGRWCRKCWAPKPERAHHCSLCGQCVLKMDHHCPWLGHRCIGHQTYPAFVHFLTTIVLLSFYIAFINILVIKWSLSNPLGVDPNTPIHSIFLVFAGIVFTIVIGSFLLYHVYLISTNQTTLEHISPFLLLKHLPSLPPSGHDLSDPPLEQELSYAQRKLVRSTHSHLNMYDLGWRRNWAQAMGWIRPQGWVERILYGGASPGDGRSFPRNPHADDVLSRLASDLVNADKDR